MKDTNRRSMLAILAGATAASRAQAGSPANAATRTLKPTMVRQSELQTVIDLWNQAERVAAGIRLRLELGAEMERGKWGVSTYGAMSLSERMEAGGGWNIGAQGVAGLDILPVEDLAYTKRLELQHSERDQGRLGFVLV